MNLKKEKERIKKFGEVFTPNELVDRSLNLIPIEHWVDLNRNIFEPSCGDGNFLIKILEKKVQYTQDIIKSLSCIYGIDIMKDNITIARKRVLKKAIELGLNENDLEIAVQIIKKNIKQGNTLEIDIEKFFEE